MGDPDEGAYYFSILDSSGLTTYHKSELMRCTYTDAVLAAEIKWLEINKSLIDGTFDHSKKVRQGKKKYYRDEGTMY
jgi:hypothetical protein